MLQYVQCCNVDSVSSAEEWEQLWFVYCSCYCIHTWGKEINTTTFTQTQIFVLQKHMVNEFEVVDGKVVFDPNSFKYWFPGMERNYSIHGQPARKVKATTNLKFPRNYDRDGDDLFPAEDIVHLMDAYTLAICKEEQFVTEQEEGLETELVEGNEEGDEDEVMFAGSKPASKPTSPSSPPVKLLKVQAAPKIPVEIVEADKVQAAPKVTVEIVEEDIEDQDQVQNDELRTLEEKVNKSQT